MFCGLETYRLTKELCNILAKIAFEHFRRKNLTGFIIQKSCDL